MQFSFRTSTSHTYLSTYRDSSRNTSDVDLIPTVQPAFKDRTDMDLLEILRPNLSKELPILEIESVEMTCVYELREVLKRHAKDNFKMSDAGESIEDRDEVEEGAVLVRFWGIVGVIGKSY
ncbi:predicted protein [Sclerotinia sclerotiorum 1980 UF-70]|uniref:Uncharacterized protein n=1 Tax=Sclerotinia sclerotiorum (strain ATCC 18683 / 1980 / Ss-1) TaxID=665079 RepID=A7F2Q5_SCLS1|nr:predicted protein [Sclerotinia sclerotiorum 1980 UF-70]EDN95997.1 predicted protein [Sclerotinia sclerotiorum 1980 UF-70]